MRLRRLREDEGYTVAVAVGAMFLVSILTAATLAATNGDLHLTRNDLDHKRAYEAAQAGIADYAFHLSTDTGYWAQVHLGSEPERGQPAGVDSEAPVGRRVHRTSRTRSSSCPRSGQSACSTTNPATSMLEPSGPMAGSFRVRSTGYSGNEDVVDRRHLQAGELPRLRLLHPARDLGPGDLRQLVDDRRRQPAVHEDLPAGAR